MDPEKYYVASSRGHRKKGKFYFMCAEIFFVRGTCCCTWKFLSMYNGEREKQVRLAVQIRKQA